MRRFPGGPDRFRAFAFGQLLLLGGAGLYAGAVFIDFAIELCENPRQKGL
jgi:hypothetical protein